MRKRALASSAECCGNAEMTKRATAVDPELKAGNITRLKRIEGQIRGLQRMVEEDRYCPDIMVQLTSVQEALRSVGRNLMKNHLRHCTTAAVRNGEPEKIDEMYEELLEIIFKQHR